MDSWLHLVDTSFTPKAFSPTLEHSSTIFIATMEYPF